MTAGRDEEREPDAARPEPDRPTDLGGLADRLEVASRRRDEPVAPYEIRPAGQWSNLARTAVGSIAGVLVLCFLGFPFWILWVVVGIALGGQLVVTLTRSRRPLVRVDDHGVTLHAGGWSREGHYPWSSLLEVGWVPAAEGRRSLVVRPRHPDPTGPGPEDPAVLTVPAYGDAAQAEVRDVLAHACGRHGVVFSEDPEALGEAPPEGPFR